MCIGIPGEILEVSPNQPGIATVELVGVRRTINIGMFDVGEITPGDWVLVHVGCAMSKMDKEEARATLALLDGFFQDYDNGLVVASDAGPRD